MSGNNISTTKSSMGEKDVTGGNHLTICLTPVMIGAFLGNALVILAFYKGPRKIRTHTNYFVVNLAVSDLMVGCLSLPLWIVINLGYIKLSDYLVPMDLLFGVTSIYSLVAISLERLYAVKYPAKHHNLQKKSVVMAIACIWGLGIVLFITVSVITYVNNDLNTHRAWMTPLVCLTFVLPLIIITTSYIILFTAAFRLTKADNQPMSLTREIRIAKTISVIIGLFCVCWAPFLILNLLFSYDVVKRWKGLGTAVHVTKALHYMNSMMNVFVYAVRSPDFYETFRKIILGCGDVVRDRANTLLSIKDRDGSSSRTQLAPLNRGSYLSSVNTDIVYISDDPDGRESYRLPNISENCKLTDSVFTEVEATNDRKEAVL